MLKFAYRLNLNNQTTFQIDIILESGLLGQLSFVLENWQIESSNRGNQAGRTAPPEGAELYI